MLRSYQKPDRANVLHPSEGFHSGDPTIVTGGSGISLAEVTGRTLIDGFAALYCVNIGYERTEVADAIASQARRLFFSRTKGPSQI